MQSKYSLFHWAWRNIRKLLIEFGLAEFLLYYGRLGLNETRRYLAHRYLRSPKPEVSWYGLEIGALHFPLDLPPGTRAIYVDKYLPSDFKAQNLQLSSTPLITPDIITNGFNLNCLTDASQDFVIANHVLEHSSDALGTLCNWLRVLRPSGILFVTVPLGNCCFDRGRNITPLTHFLDDYYYTAAGNYAIMRQRNLVHVEEHFSICAPAIARELGENYVPPNLEDRALITERLLGNEADLMHHHVFSINSFAALLNSLNRNIKLPTHVEWVVRSRSETIGIVRKLT